MTKFVDRSEDCRERQVAGSAPVVGKAIMGGIVFGHRPGVLWESGYSWPVSFLPEPSVVVSAMILGGDAR